MRYETPVSDFICFSFKAICFLTHSLFLPHSLHLSLASPHYADDVSFQLPKSRQVNAKNGYKIILIKNQC